MLNGPGHPFSSPKALLGANVQPLWMPPRLFHQGSHRSLHCTRIILNTASWASLTRRGGTGKGRGEEAVLGEPPAGRQDQEGCTERWVAVTASLGDRRRGARRTVRSGAPQTLTWMSGRQGRLTRVWVWPCAELPQSHPAKRIQKNLSQRGCSQGGAGTKGLVGSSAQGSLNAGDLS